MKINITMRHFKPHEGLREYVENKVSSCVDKHFPKAIEAEVILVMEKQRYSAEVDIKIRGISFHAREEMRDIHELIDIVMRKLETQMRRYKEKRRDHKKRGIEKRDNEK